MRAHTYKPLQSAYSHFMQAAATHIKINDNQVHTQLDDPICMLVFDEKASDAAT